MKILILFCIASVALGFPGISKNDQAHTKRAQDFFNPLLKSIVKPSIVGGTDAKPHSAPHQISLQIYEYDEWKHNCGGSIVEADKIITAGHCVYGHDVAYLRVVAGDHDLTKVDGTEQVAAVAEAIAHPLYDDINVDYDYGIIRLATKLNLNANVATITLPSSSNYSPSGNCINTGWGNIRGDGTVFKPAILQEVTVPIVDWDECRNNFEGFNEVTDRMICAGAAGKGPCGGDSGGPLVCNGVLAGIVSWGYTPCGKVEYPGVYAEVADALDWFANN